jgi:hypothetical protein
MFGSTSFGWMTPFDCFNFLLKLCSPGTVSSGAPGVGVGLGARLGPCRGGDERDPGDQQAKS